VKVVDVETVVVGTPWRELTFVELLTEEYGRAGEVPAARGPAPTSASSGRAGSAAAPRRQRHSRMVSSRGWPPPTC
jgi:hypothetical protein